MGEGGLVERVVQRPKALDPQMLERVRTRGGGGQCGRRFDSSLHDADACRDGGPAALRGRQQNQRLPPSLPPSPLPPSPS